MGPCRVEVMVHDFGIEALGFRARRHGVSQNRDGLEGVPGQDFKVQGLRSGL